MHNQLNDGIIFALFRFPIKIMSNIPNWVILDPGKFLSFFQKKTNHL